MFSHTTHGSNTTDACTREVCPWTGAKSSCNGKVSMFAKIHASNEMALPLQTWLAGSTASDLLIAAAMLYHVDLFRLA